MSIPHNSDFHHGLLVLQGTDLGELYAFDAGTGDQLFLYQHDRPIRASPMTYQVNGKQYISVVSTNTLLTFALPCPVEYTVPGG